MLYGKRFIIGLSLLMAQTINTPAADAEDKLISDSFATISASHQSHTAAPDNLSAQQITQKVEDNLAALVDQSSFPIRFVNGDGEDTWDDLPPLATEPKRLRRHYGAHNCRFFLQAETFTVNLKKADETGYSEAGHALGKQSIVHLDDDQTVALALASELRITIKPGTEEACQKVFSGKKIRFANVSLSDSNLYLLNRAGERLAAKALKEPEAISAYLFWDDITNTLQIGDRAGLAIAIESGIYALPAIKAGVFYLAYEPAWTIERVSRHLAEN